MSQLDTWICPGCQRKYLAAAMVGQTICPRCQATSSAVTSPTVSVPATARPTIAAPASSAPMRGLSAAVGVAANPQRRAGWVIPLVLLAGVVLGGLIVLAIRPGGGSPAAADGGAANANADAGAKAGADAGANAGGGGPAKSPDPPRKPNPPQHDKALVEQWLKEHLNDGRWDEVRWWPSITLQAIYDIRLPEAERAVVDFQQQVDNLDRQIRDLQAKGVKIKDFSPSRVPPIGLSKQQDELWSLHDSSYHAHEKLQTCIAIVKLMKERGPRRICAMRFRAKNGFGANRIVDALFDVTDGVAMVVDEKSHTAWLDSTQFGWDYLRDPDPAHHPRRPDEFSNPMGGREAALEAERLQREQRP